MQLLPNIPSKTSKKASDMNLSLGRGFSQDPASFNNTQDSTEDPSRHLQDPVMFERKLLEACKALNIMPEEIGRTQLIAVAKHVGLKITHAEATEAVLQARGIEMEKSRGIKLASLTSWFFDHMEIIKLRTHKKPNKVFFMTR